jgi:hypothetical protein
MAVQLQNRKPKEVIEQEKKQELELRDGGESALTHPIDPALLDWGTGLQNYKCRSIDISALHTG